MPPPPYPGSPQALEAAAARVLAGAARQIPINAPSAGSGPGSGFRNIPATAHAPGEPGAAGPSGGMALDRDPGQGVGSAAPGGKQRRVPEAARRSVALEARVPLYVLSPAGGRGTGLSRRRLFRHAHAQLRHAQGCALQPTCSSNSLVFPLVCHSCVW